MDLDLLPTVEYFPIALGQYLGIHQPLYTAGSLVTVSTLTLLNFHQVMMRPYKSISTRQIWLSWIPNLIMSAVVIGVLTSAVLLV